MNLDELALGLLEVGSSTASVAALDAAEKAADVRLVQLEMNDQLGASLKFAGEPAAISAAIAAGEEQARRLQANVVTAVIHRPSTETLATMPLVPEFNPLLEQHVILTPEANPMPPAATYAIGLIETQGFTAVIEAVDAACKAANVETIGREKLGGGYICVVIRGDVAAVRAACEAATSRLADQKLGKLVASHVIARPSNSVLSLLPSNA